MMKKLMTLIFTIATLTISAGASALEPANAPVSASAQIHLAADVALETSELHAQKLESRRVRAGSPDIAVNERGEITSFGRVLEGEELYLVLGRPDLADAMKERERERDIGKALIVVGVTGQVVSAVWLAAEFGNLMSNFIYPAGAGRGSDFSLVGPLAVGFTSAGLLGGGIYMVSRRSDPLTPAERIELMETQLGVPKANSPKIQMTMRF